MRDLWTRRIASLLLGGIIGVYTPERMRWIVLGVFLLLVIRMGLWKPRDFFGPSFRPEILVLGIGLFVGIIYGMTGNAGLEKPLVLNRVEVVGELMDWTTNNEGASGIIKVLEPIPIPMPKISPSVEESSPQTQENTFNFQDKKYRLKVYPDSEGELPEGWEKVRPGDVLRFSAKLEQPKPPGTPGQFDLPLYYAVRGISGGLTAQGNAEIVSPGTSPLSWQVRNRVHEVLELIPNAKIGILEGVLFGDTSQIPEEDLERYRITGVYHVFSASGSNVAFLLLLSWGVLRFLPPILRVGITIAVLIFYAFLSWGNPPILRATVMGIFVLVGSSGSGRKNSLRGLFIATFLLFVWQPLFLKDIGFQLSFMATWGIIVLTPRLVCIQRIRRWPQGLKMAFTTTCAAQIATLPLLISAFHRLSFIGLVANLGVLFIMGSIFALGMLGVILSFLPNLALPFFQVSLWLVSATSELLFRLARVPWADAWVINPGVLFWVYWYGGILAYLVGKERVLFTGRVWRANLRRWITPYVQPMWVAIQPERLSSRIRLRLGEVKSKLAALMRLGGRMGIKGERALFVLLVLLLLWSPWHNPQVLEVTFIDVGQGDSVLIETPKGTRILVDTGPKSERFDAGERIILPFLLQSGIKNLDALILTHSHLDHVGGAAAILETIPVDWVGVPEDGQDWLSGAAGINEGDSAGWTEGSGLDQKLVKLLVNKKIERLKAGDRLLLDSDIQISVLAPGKILTGTNSDSNNNSIVLRLENRAGQSVLLTGDMEAEEMKEILDTGQDFSADLFKVPHHGSRFSLLPDWLNQINPQAVVISVGKNPFGHPTPGVLKYWEERRIPLYRTDEDGTIRVRLDEERIEVLPGRQK